MNKNGFTLIELLVAVAIIGILSAVGAVAYLGYVDSARQQQAKTGLSSIAMQQEEYRAMNRVYYPGTANACNDNDNDNTSINNGLFNGDQVLEDDNYTFCIATPANGLSYTAHAYSVETGNNDTFSITNTKVKASSIDGNAGTW
tara:strand:+ start:151 stop:582 length:432 start_codon:yes stop_codon:yes gene_type:complete